MAEILAFPLARRAALVREQAGWFLAQDGRERAERSLGRFIDLHRQSLVSKGIGKEAADAQAVALEVAIRSHACRLMLAGVQYEA